jgi:hypothetical protein
MQLHASMVAFPVGMLGGGVYYRKQGGSSAHRPGQMMTMTAMRCIAINKAVNPSNWLLYKLMHVKPAVGNRVAGMLARSVPVRSNAPHITAAVTDLGISNDIQNALVEMHISEATEIQVTL